MSFWTSFLVWYATWPWTWRECFGAYFENWFWIFGFFVVLFLACLVFWIDFCYIFGTNFEQTVDIHFEWFLIIFGNISWIIFVRANMLRDTIGDWQYHRSYKIWEYNFWFYRTLHRLKRRFLNTEKLKRIICCKLFYFTMIIKNT